MEPKIRRGASKMSTTVNCYKCKKTANEKNTILCTKCKNHYEFDCIGLSEKLYRLMDTTKKQIWKCQSCLQNKTQIVPTTITTRKNNANKRFENTTKSPGSVEVQTPSTSAIAEKSSPSPSPESEVSCDSQNITQDNMTDDICSFTERLSRSVENTITNDTSIDYDLLRDEIDQLKIKLISTENELENNILENNELKKNEAKLTKELQFLKKILKSPTISNQDSKRDSLQSSEFSTPPKAPSSPKNTRTPAPSITKCKAADTECIKQSAQALLPLLAEGKLFGQLKTLDPLAIDKIDATQQNLQLIASGFTVKGLKECTIDSISRDAAKSKMNVNVLCSVLVEGEYEIKVKILVFKLDGQGHLVVTLPKILISVDVDLDEIEKDGKKHLNIKHWDFTYSIKEKANIELSNLFNGSEKTTQAIRDLFAASANEIVTELGPIIIKAITTEVVNTVNDFFHLVPTEDLALD